MERERPWWVLAESWEVLRGLTFSLSLPGAPAVFPALKFT